MFQDASDFNINHGEFNNVAGDYHQHHTHYAPGTPVNNIGSVTNANFGTNYGYITQTSGGSSPPPPPQGRYRGPPEPPGGYWPPMTHGYTEPPPHHGPPYPPGGYWNGPRQVPNPQPRYNYPAQNRGYGYEPPQSWDQEVRYGPEGGHQGHEWDQRGQSDRSPPQQPSNQGRYSGPPPRQQQQRFSDRGSRGPSPAPQHNNRYPDGLNRTYSAPPNQPPNQPPTRESTCDDIYVNATPPPPARPHSQTSTSKAGYREPPAQVDSESESDDVDMDEAREGIDRLHLSVTANVTSVQRGNRQNINNSAKRA